MFNRFNLFNRRSQTTNHEDSHSLARSGSVLAAAAAAATTVALTVSPLATTSPAHAQPVASEAITWEDCPATVDNPRAQCGRIPVPLRYDDPDGPKISVGFVRVSAQQPDARRGALFGNPGGPGGDGYVYFGADKLGFAWPQEIRNEWDMVAVQPRGLPHSTPLDCTPQPSGDLGGQLRDQFNAQVNHGAYYREQCEKNTPGLVDTLNTETNARDWESVRAALGYETISIMGLSYGTYLGSAYASMYPQRTDKVVLDSAMDPNAQWLALLDQQIAGYENGLHEYFDFVARNDATYHMGDTPLKAYQYWSAKIVEQSGTNPTVVPPPARVGDLPPGLEFAGQAGADAMTATGKARVEADGIVSRMLNPGALQLNSPLLGASRQIIPAPADWDILARMTNGTLEETGDGLSDAVMEEINQSSIANTNMVFTQACHENITPPNYALLPRALWDNYVSQDSYTALNSMFGAGVMCNGAPSTAKPVPLNGSQLATRPLQINALRDPQTPYHGRHTIHNAMGTQLVTVHGPGHGHVARGNAAVDKIVVDYLRDGTVTQHDAPGFFDQQG